jgi:hypothetical protein
VHHHDWQVGKGVGLARVLTPSGVVDVYVSHFVSQYEDESDEYIAHRVAQALEAASFVR